MDQLYPKKGVERWIKLLLKKNGSQKKLLTIEAHPHSQNIPFFLNIFTQ